MHVLRWLSRFQVKAAEILFSFSWKEEPFWHLKRVWEVPVSDPTLVVHAGGAAWAAVGKGKLVPGCHCGHAGGPCARFHHPRRTVGLTQAREHCPRPPRTGCWGRSRALPSHTGKGSDVQEKTPSAHIGYWCCNLFYAGFMSSVKKCHHTK